MYNSNDPSIFVHPFEWVIWCWILSSVRPGQSSFEISENNRHSTQNGLSSTFWWYGAALAQISLNDKKNSTVNLWANILEQIIKRSAAGICSIELMHFYSSMALRTIWKFDSFVLDISMLAVFQHFLFQVFKREFVSVKRRRERKKCTSKIEMSTMNSLWKCYEKE